MEVKKRSSLECIEQYLCQFAMETPDISAIIVKDEITTYEKLWQLVRGAARYLSEEIGVKKGDCVVVRAMQNLEYGIAYFGTHLLGAIFVPLEKSLPADKTQEILHETEAKAYISREDLPDTEIAYVNLRELKKIAEEYFCDSWEWEFPSRQDSADIMYTTGTTGRAKGVEVTHDVLISTAENYISGFCMQKGNVMAVPGPMNHVNPLRKMYTSIMTGNTVVILDGMLSVKTFYEALDTYHVNSLCLPPALLRMLWKLSGEKLAEYADQIEFVECSTAPVTEADKEHLRRQLPKSRLYNNYGLSECGAMVMYDFNEFKEKGQGCVGKPMVNSHVVIVDDERKEIKSSKEQMGLIANSGSINMKGYWKHPEITAQVKQNGYVYTNDIGYFDEEGFLYVIGRQNDTINVGGLKVEPTEVEDAAGQYPGVFECICVPVDDPLTGKALKLIVVMEKGHAMDEAGLAAHLRKCLDPYKVPAIYEEADHIPRNYVGKPDRKAFIK